MIKVNIEQVALSRPPRTHCIEVVIPSTPAPIRLRTPYAMPYLTAKAVKETLERKLANAISPA